MTEAGVDLYSCTSCIFTNCLITANGAYGIQKSTSRSTATAFVNCTLTANLSGGIYFRNSPIEIKNTIIWGNTTGINTIESSEKDITFSDIENFEATGEGNIDSNPLFAGSNDYRLTQNSPCVDTGTSDGAPNTEIDGSPRALGSNYDMGAYEYVPPCPNCSGTSVNLTNKIFPPGKVCECVGTVSITIGPGVTIPAGATVTFIAPKIEVKQGFHAENGAVVNMRQN